MSTAALFVEAVDTAVVLAKALVGWLIFIAVTASILAIAAIACGAWAVDLAWGRLWRRWRSAAVSEAPEPPPSPKRSHARTAPRTPSWAHTQPLDDDFEEAA